MKLISVADGKWVLKRAIRQQLLDSQELIGRMADMTKTRITKPTSGDHVQFQTIQARIKNESPILTSKESEYIIREVLGLTPDTEIYDFVPLHNPADHHE